MPEQSIKILFFASLQEIVKQHSTVIPTDTPLSPKQLWKIATPDIDIPNNTLVAINQEYATLDNTAKPGDEVAFFPPVTGG